MSDFIFRPNQPHPHFGFQPPSPVNASLSLFLYANTVESLLTDTENLLLNKNFFSYPSCSIEVVYVLSGIRCTFLISNTNTKERGTFDPIWETPRFFEARIKSALSFAAKKCTPINFTSLKSEIKICAILFHCSFYSMWKVAFWVRGCVLFKYIISTVINSCHASSFFLPFLITVYKMSLLPSHRFYTRFVTFISRQSRSRSTVLVNCNKQIGSFLKEMEEIIDFFGSTKWTHAEEGFLGQKRNLWAKDHFTDWPQGWCKNSWLEGPAGHSLTMNSNS